MISFVEGKLFSKTHNNIIVNVHGLGYEIEIPNSFNLTNIEIGQSINLFTHFVVREDAQILYGFANKEDRDLFRILIKVSGVGPKIGLSFLSHMSAIQIINCIKNSDNDALTKIPGIGAKTAKRIIIEVKDKIDTLQYEPTGEYNYKNKIIKSDSVGEATKALEVLGYKSQDAYRLVQKVYDENMDTQSIIRLALKQISNR